MAVKLRPTSNKSSRIRRPDKMKHRTSGRGKGRWHNRKVLWRARAKARRKRAISAESRRRNRG